MSIFAGRYQIERVLGEGATAVVYLGRDMQGGRAVAIKLLRPELAESTMNGRFLKEIRRTALLDHPRILPVLDIGEEEGRPFFTLPYMEGGTLRRRIKRERQLDIFEAIAITRSVGEALDYAHERGLVHRDVKPENILFSRGTAHLGDFGIARALSNTFGENSTSANIVRGTAAYMSPEQSQASPSLDGRSDLYSLACVFYEMITGMPAFTGPTAENIIAQRLLHPPRALRVYRPTVADALDTVVAKALNVVPADRYSTASDFVGALEAAARAGPATAPAWVRFRRDPRMLVGGTAVLALLAIGAYVAATPVASDEVVLDTTRIVLLPVEQDTVLPRPWSDYDLFRQAMSRWDGIKVVDHYQVADAIRQQGGVRSTTDAAAVARRLGAGRYVRARVTREGDNRRLSASLYDARSDSRLYEGGADIPSTLDAANLAYAHLADSLLIRGGASIPPDVLDPGTRSLSAIHAFGRAQAALDDWDLVRADSGFVAAITADHEFARANLWLAQARAWQNAPVASWRTIAERAAALETRLTERERQLAAALVALGAGQHEVACATYEALRARNDRDFAALFGLGQCRTQNRRVLEDSSSPSGWRFEANIHRAMQSYVAAFEVLPSVHRGFERGAFERLRIILLLGQVGYNGVGARDSATFFGRPGWLGDSLVMVPYPWQRYSGGTAPEPPGFERAIAHQRQVFQQIALRWSAAFPSSAGAKHGVAVALEQLDDDRAIDTLRAARALATDPLRKLRLAADEVMMLVKFGLGRSEERIARATALADTLLASADSASGESASRLLPVAALTGRCALALRLIEVSTRAEFQIPVPTLRQSRAVLASRAMGCGADAAALRQLAAEADRLASAQPSQRGFLDVTLLYRAALLGAPYDRDVLRRLAAVAKGAPVMAALALSEGDRAAAARALAPLRADAPRMKGEITPDIAFISARMFLALADTAGATSVLDRALAGVQTMDVASLSDFGAAAMLTQAVALRADLATARREADAGRWTFVRAKLLPGPHLDKPISP